MIQIINPGSGGGAPASGVAAGRAKFGGVAQLSMPGVPTGTVSTFTTSVNRAQYYPLLVPTAITIDQLVCEVTTSGATTSRIALYNADTDWQPTTLVTGTDIGTIDVSTTGVKTQALADTALAAGRYLVWQNIGGASIAFRSIIASAGPLLGFPVALGGSPGFAQIFASQTYGAAPSTGLVWDTTATGSPVSFNWPVWLRVKTP